MSYKYWLPGENGNKTDQETNSNAVIIIGANGAGKSHLGAWIEQQDMLNVHRIGAQRSLNFKDDIPLKNYSQAEDTVMFGTSDVRHRNQKIFKWGSVQDGEYTTKLVDDFENVLSALIAIRNNEANQYFENCKNAEQNRKEKPNVPETVIEKLQNIWNDIFPHRQIVFEDSKFRAKQNAEIDEKLYSATKMSDGERSVLYFVAQVLCVPEGKTLIVDEPELHLHKSLTSRLWTTLEKYRPDCLFIYITHDTQFAASHSDADIIWVKEYDGDKKWRYEKLNRSDLPEDLLLELLGNRKPVLFVEGTRNSFDTQLYTEIYKGYYVVACGSCMQVISRTKAFRNNPMLHHNTVYGLIDRDFRSDYEISQYESDGIYTLDVAEVENLFITEDMIRAAANHMGADADDTFSKVRDYVVNTKFKNMINSQICQAVVSEIKYRLTVAEISKKNETEAKDSLNDLLNNMDYDAIKAEIEKRFNDALNSGDYSQIIRVFNEKGISKSIGEFIDGIDKKEYCRFVVNQIKAGNSTFVDAVKKYIPTENKIPIVCTV